MDIDERFMIQFPVWLIGRRDGFIKGLVKSTANGHSAVPLFTDNDLAQTFLDASPYPDIYEIRQFSDLELLGVTTILQTIGVTHVIADPNKTRAEAFELSELQKDLISLCQT